MNAHKESQLDDCYEYSQKDVAEKLFMSVNTVIKLERQAIINFKKALEERGLTMQDMLND